MKILRIKNCYDCPFAEFWIAMEDNVRWVCKKENRKLPAPLPYSPPEWCPLDDKDNHLATTS